MNSEILAILANEFINNDNSFMLSEVLQNIREMTSATSTNLLLCVSMLRETHIRPDNYYEDWLPHYLNMDFYRLFRMSREVFEKFLQIINQRIGTKIYHGGNIPIPQDKCLLITLWYLGKGETLISIADKFNISESSVLKITEEYIEVISNLISEYIKWPNNEECPIVEQQFMALAGYPGVIGALDGCHIPCKVPDNQQSSYLNRKQSHSIILQGICTANYIFTNIFVGFPGSAHDSRVFQNSSLHKNIEQFTASRYFYEKYHILGDSAYFLRDWLITPYIDNGRLTAAEKNHNHIHSRTRVVIENTFGRLKGRWRILQYVNTYSIRKVVQITTACCVLHNFTHLLGDNMDIDLSETYMDDYPEDPMPTAAARMNNLQGIIKRNHIKDML